MSIAYFSLVSHYLQGMFVI